MKKPIEIGLWIIIFAPLIIFYAFVGPIAQNEAFHNFVDDQTIVGIKNFHNIITNIGYLIVGMIGVIDYFRKDTRYSLSWIFFFISVILIAPGSAYYHDTPNSTTLVWDRLPMTFAFMSLTSVVLCELYKIKNHLKLLIPLLGLGAFSVWWWTYSGDLRIYYWVQLTPILSLLYVSFAVKTQSLKKKNMVAGVLLYGLAMLCEKKDAPIFEALDYSGHSIKHILAALAILAIVLMKYRKGDLKT